MFKKKKDKKMKLDKALKYPSVHHFPKDELYYWPRTIYDYPELKKLLEKEKKDEKPV